MCARIIVQCHSLRQTRCGSHGWTLHSVHGVSQQQQLTCLQQACSLQQLERGYATRPHGYNARHHDAHALHSSQRAHISTVRPRQTRVVGCAHPKPVRKSSWKRVALKRDGALLSSSTLIVDVVQCPYNGGVIQSSGRQTHCRRGLMATRFQLLDFIVSLTVTHIMITSLRCITSLVI